MDESSTPSNRRSKRQRVLLIILPFILLLLCLGGLNLWARSVVSTTPAAPTKPIKQITTAVPTNAPALQPINTETTVSTLVPTAVPPPTSILIPTLPPTATITLLGPPDQSRFMVEDNITVYWTWPLLLTEDQYFGVYLQEETEESRIGRLEEANFGTGYRWQTEAQYLTDDGGEVSYLIKLETILANEPLITSEPRTIFILNMNE
jgi:hypothetical protein